MTPGSPSRRAAIISAACERADPRERLGLLHQWIIDGDLLLYAAEPRRIVAYVWTDTERPSQEQEEWIDVFSSVVDLFGRVSDTDEELSGELTIFRGRAGDEEHPGMSWTLSREKAEWFARRFPRHGEPVVYTATVEAGARARLLHRPRRERGRCGAGDARCGSRCSHRRDRARRQEPLARLADGQDLPACGLILLSVAISVITFPGYPPPSRSRERWGLVAGNGSLGG